MGKRLERFGEVRIVDKSNGFGPDFVLVVIKDVNQAVDG